MTIFSELSNITEKEALKELEALAKEERPTVKAHVVMAKAGITKDKMAGTYTTADGRRVVVRMHTAGEKPLIPEKKPRLKKAEVNETEVAQAAVQTTHLIDQDGHELSEDV
jgi:hypothetical protein